jgi:hypothetical protein
MKSNLSNLVTSLPVQQRRPRGDKIVNPLQVHYAYRVRYISDRKPHEINVSQKVHLYVE